MADKDKIIFIAPRTGMSMPFSPSLVMNAIPEVGALLSDTPLLNKIGRDVQAVYPELAAWDVQAAAEAYIFCARQIGIPDDVVERSESLLPKLCEVLAKASLSERLKEAYADTTKEELDAMFTNCQIKIVPTNTNRLMTDILLEGLIKAGVSVARTEKRQEKGDADLICLRCDFYFAVDYERTPRIGISLNERMPVGGDMMIADWMLKEGDSLEQIVNAAKQV